MPDAIEHLAPTDAEAAVLSLVAVPDGSGWTAICGSLLTVPLAVAYTSWDRWEQQQPLWRASPLGRGFDLGPNFVAEPFPGVRIVRNIIKSSDWPNAIDEIRAGRLNTPFAPIRLRTERWSSTVFFGQGGTSETHTVLLGARRPVSGVFAELDSPPVPPTSDTWEWATPAYLRPGPDLGAIAPHRRVLHWPRQLLGIDWLGHPDHAPARRFVIGRLHQDAWIARTYPDPDNDQLIVSLGWHADRIDPLGCLLQIRSETDGHPALLLQVRITDLPSGDPQVLPGQVEPRNHPWNKRTLDVRIPRGPRFSSFGVELWSPNGRLLDYRPVARRYESITTSFFFGGSSSHSTSTVGDARSAPTAAERDEAVRTAIAVDEQARHAAAARRVSTSGQLSHYLHWRFSCRAGELLIADPFLFGNEAETTIAFLEQLDRPIRALTGGIPNVAVEPLQDASDWLQVRALAKGRKSLHDRVWIVGESGLLVGTSITDLVAPRPVPAASTITELPFADATTWRRQFDAWWVDSQRPPSGSVPPKPPPVSGGREGRATPVAEDRRSER